MADHITAAIHRLQLTRARLTAASETATEDLIPLAHATRSKSQASEGERGAFSGPLLADGSLAPTGGPLTKEGLQACLDAALHAAEAASAAADLGTPQQRGETLAHVTEAARALAESQLLQARCAEAEAMRALQAVDLGHAAGAAMEAGKAAGLAIWAASVGGHAVLQDLAPDLEAAQAAAVRAAWAVVETQAACETEQAAAGNNSIGEPAACGAHPVTAPHALVTSPAGACIAEQGAAAATGETAAAAHHVDADVDTAHGAPLPVVDRSSAAAVLGADDPAADAACGAGAHGAAAAPDQPHPATAERAAAAAATQPAEPSTSIRRQSSGEVGVATTAACDRDPLKRDSAEGSGAPASATHATAQPYEPYKPYEPEVLDLPTALGGLVTAAGHITEDGRLPVTPLALAFRSSLSLLSQLKQSDVAVAQHFCAPRQRTAVMRLLSLAVRQLAVAPTSPEPPTEPAASLKSATGTHVGQRDQWQVVFHACMRLLDAFFVDLDVWGLRERYSKEAATITVAMNRTDLMPALSRLSAAAAEVAAAAAGSSGGDAGSGISHKVGGGGSTGRREGELANWVAIIRSTCWLLEAWHRAEERNRARPSEHLHLRSAVLGSHVLEHTARAVVALLAAVAPARSGPVVTALAESVMVLLRCACMRRPAEAALDLTDATGAELLSRGRASVLLSLRPEELLSSSPCLQHLVLLHIVAQLCAADGGSDYGLPPAAQLPAFMADDWAAFLAPSRCEDSAVAGSAGGGSAGWDALGLVLRQAFFDRLKLLDRMDLPMDVRLNGTFISSALERWRRTLANPCVPQLLPCSRRALWALSMRVAAAAEASWESADRDGGGGCDGRGRRAAEGKVRAARYHFRDPELLGLQALGLAVALSEWQDSRMAKLWAPVVRAARRASRNASASACGRLASIASEVLLTLQLSVRRLGLSMPPDPPPDVASALASGFVECLESTIRRRARVRGSPEVVAAACLGLGAALMDQFRRLAELLAYGNPRTLASVVVTAAKALRRGLAAAAQPAAPAEAMRKLGVECATLAALCEERGSGALLTALSHMGFAIHGALMPGWCGGPDARPEDRLWWRRHDAAGRASRDVPAPGARPAAPGSGGAALRRADRDTASNGESGGEGGAGGDDGGTGAAAADTSPSQQLLVLASWALLQWMPVLSYGVLALEGCGISSCIATGAVLPWVPPLVLAYLDCYAATEEVKAVAAAATAVGGRAAAPTASDVWDAATTMLSWQALLLRDMELPRLLVAVGQPSPRDMWTGYDMDPVVDALLHVAVAFPEEARAVLWAPSRNVHGLTVLQALQRPAVGDDCDAARFFSQVLATVASGREPSAAMVARLRSGAYRCKGAGDGNDFGGGWALRAAPLLPPPVEAVAMLQLRLCSNPCCVNLGGDSEAALRLSGCSRCGGGAVYCSKDCQVAHWRAGHKDECAKLAKRRELRRAELGTAVV